MTNLFSESETYVKTLPPWFQRSFESLSFSACEDHSVHFHSLVSSSSAQFVPSVSSVGQQESLVLSQTSVHIVIVVLLDGMAFLKSSVEDLKQHLHKVYEVVCMGIKAHRESADDMRYISQQLTCQDSRIDDLECNLYELMGFVDVIKEEILKMVKMSQCSHCQESPYVQNANNRENISSTTTVWPEGL